jgi:hypothetical protein
LIYLQFGIFSFGYEEGMVMMMRKAFRFLILTVFLVSCATAIGSGALAQVVINEFLADPARDWDGDGLYSYRDDEWVEIANLGASTAGLDGYYLTDGEGPSVWRYGFSGSLAPGAVIAVYGSDAKAWEESAGYPVYGLSLNNVGDVVSLYRVTGEDTVLVDSFKYGDRAADDDRSVGRDIGAQEMWMIFDALNPCSDSCVPAGCGCIPTPEEANYCYTASGPESWSRIKSRYRD